LKPDAIEDQAIQVWGVNDWISGTVHGIPALIIGKQEYDVWPLFRGFSTTGNQTGETGNGD
jgi:hypothetical protein